MLSSLQGPDRALASPRVKDMVASWKAAAPESPIVVDGDGPQADLRLGTPNAPISIVEFADFECPGCRRMYVMLHSLLKEYDGKYSFVFKNYPLDQDCNPTITRRFHIHACNAAYFTRCAGEQGKLREAVDYVFTTPILDDAEALTSIEVQDAIVEKGSAQLGLDEAAVRECVASKRYKAKLQGDVEEGRRLNLTGTPAIWVNGKLVKSSNPEVFKAIFNSILAEKK